MNIVTHEGCVLSFDQKTLFFEVFDKMLNKVVKLHCTSYFSRVPYGLPQCNEIIVLLYQNDRLIGARPERT